MMSRLLLAFLCFATVFPAPAAKADTLQQRVDRLQTAMLVHKNEVATQDIVVHLTDSVMDLRTESRVIYDEGTVQTTFQTLREGTVPHEFQYLPAILVHPLRRLPTVFVPPVQHIKNASITVSPAEGSGKAIFRILPNEKINGTVYEVLEVTQYSSSEEMMECDKPGLVVTRIVCKLYVGSDGLVERKSGVLFYRDFVVTPAAGKSTKKPREQRATFESIRIEYTNPPEGAPGHNTLPVPHDL